MAHSKSQTKSTSRPLPSSPAPAGARTPSAPPTVSGRWLLAAIAIVIPVAALCTWAAFCLLFWQGSWQLLYHPSATVARTPSNVGLAYDPVAFATTNAGVTRLQGWWIPAPSARATALYLHDQAGNLGDTLGVLANLHASGVNVLAFDYRGYGQSQFVRPNQARWQQDANWALAYLTGTRHIDPHSIVIVGSGLGANLALGVAARHPELAGVVLDSPLDAPANIIFNDARAALVPARLLVHDRYDLAAPAAALRIPSLWLIENSGSSQSAPPAVDAAFQKVTATKRRVWLSASSASQQVLAPAFQRWLGDLHP